VKVPETAFQTVMNVVVIWIPPEEKHVPVYTASGGIQLPDTSRAEHPMCKCYVYCAGPDCKNVKTGDWVLIPVTEPLRHARYCNTELYAAVETQIVGILPREPQHEIHT
jgi:hypothetical protein